MYSDVTHHHYAQILQKLHINMKHYFFLKVYEYLSETLHIINKYFACVCNCKCLVYVLPLDCQLLVGCLLNVNHNFLVQSRTKFEALFVLVFCNSTEYSYKEIVMFYISTSI